MENFLLIFCLIIFSLIFLIRKKITNKLGIIDRPDNKRKLHKNNTSTIGGLLLTTIIIFFFLIFSISEEINNSLIISSVTYVLILSIGGVIDDRKSIKVNNKFILFIASTFVFLLLNENLIVNKVYFNFIDKEIYLFGFAIFYTVFCILLLINSFNLIDGENGIFLSYMIFLFFIFFYKQNFIFYFFFSLMLFILVCNIKNIFFSGNSGTNIGSSFFALITLYFYNSKMIMPFTDSFLDAEKIFLIFLIPGIDMLRVFVERFLKNKHPFKPDNSHFHHLLRKIFNRDKIFIPYTIFSIAPYLIAIQKYCDDIILILIFVIFYLLLLICLKKLKRNFKFL